MDTEGGQQSNTVVVDIAGKVTIGYDAKMRDAIAEAREGGAQNILLNMRGVTRLDSSGIGELVAANSSITKDGGRLLLVGLPQKVATVLQITNLLGVLELFSDIDEAIAALEVESE
jgi:anti-sigma B factor antagonist